MTTRRAPATCCTVCGTRTYATRDPRRYACAICARALCPAHVHFYVDGNSGAITRSALPTCADCAGLIRIPCPFADCRHVVEARNPAAGAGMIGAHIEEHHGRG